MVSRRAGHFVQVFKPLGPERGRHGYVDIAGRVTSLTVTEYPAHVRDGWFFMSRELSRKDAVRFAKEYKRAGFNTRVLFKGNDGKTVIVDEFAPKK